MQDAANLLATVTPEQCSALNELVIYMGINNRGDSVETVRDQAHDVMGQSIRLNKKLSFCLIPVSEKMTSKFQGKITGVNQVLQEEIRRCLHFGLASVWSSQ